MIKLTVITDSRGQILGVVRAGPVRIAQGSVTPMMRAREGQRHHEVEVDEALLHDAQKLHDHLRKMHS